VNRLRRRGSIIILPALLCACIFLRPEASLAQLAGDEIRGTVYIEGDVNDVAWDDTGIKQWDADGNVYLKFTNHDGRIVELWGDKLRYERKMDSGIPVEWVSVQGDVRLAYGANTLDAQRIEGTLEPLVLDIEDGIKLDAVEFDLASDSLELKDTGGSTAPGLSLYKATIVGDATVVFPREIAPARPIKPAPGPIAIPLPIDVNPEFEVLTVKVGGGTVDFTDDAFTAGTFPGNAVGETDSGYTFTLVDLNMYGLEKIQGSDCSIEGPDINMRCDNMTFLPDERRLVLTGGVVLRSDAGALAVDSLTVEYDDNGVSRLDAVGNVVLDFSIILGEQAPPPDESPTGEDAGGDGPE